MDEVKEMVKGIIFDADGTLLNSMPIWENLGELYLKSMGIEAKQGLGEVLFTMSLPQAARYLIQEYHLNLTEEEIIDGLNREIEEYYAKKVPLKEGVRSFLEGFRELHIPMVIATTGDRRNLEAALKRLGIRNLFEGILTCTEMQTDKSKPDIYLAAALQMDCDPDEVIVFEDAYHAIVTAKKAGFITVGVYDQANDRDLAKIWNTADVYLPGYDDFQKFWWSMTEKGEDEV